ncbi:hypothetical protein EDC55_11614 [Allofrancisella inopinata]|uniref:Uncharacterized protein n=1 Tax=Allofrancisella inopinata TaxID=1085647 RepID=A0AAE6YJR0_9GAMM|nr:hypothetical protein [Allofrancisella inopinata]QIV96084.1 hypothetical protein E4K63_04280 [Allofrancisella inopinata]TDT69674.1 hypothetical protein EDC55_11614 [Allofrancisella inopinata]
MTLEEFKQIADRELNSYINGNKIFKQRHHTTEAKKLLNTINSSKTVSEVKYALESCKNAYSPKSPDKYVNRETFAIYNEPSQFQQFVLPPGQKYKKKNGKFYLLLELLTSTLSRANEIPSPIKREHKRNKFNAAFKKNPDEDGYIEYKRYIQELTFGNAIGKIPQVCGINDSNLALERCFDDQFINGAYGFYSSTDERSTFKDLKNYILLPFLRSLIAILKTIDNRGTIINSIFNENEIKSPLFFYHSMGGDITLIHQGYFSHFLENYPKELVIKVYKEILSCTEQAESYDDYFRLSASLKNQVYLIFKCYVDKILPKSIYTPLRYRNNSYSYKSNDSNPFQKADIIEEDIYTSPLRDSSPSVSAFEEKKEPY